jgi:methanogenic corrinoid protein MtbC1
MTIEERARDFARALLAIDRLRAREALLAAAAECDAPNVTEDVVTPALERIGDDWERGAVSLAQLYVAGRIAEQVVSETLPATSAKRGERPQLAIAVLEDHHALGKRLVLAALRASGYTVADYGHGVSVQGLLQRCHADKPRVLLISTLMLPSALHVRDVVRQLALPGSPPAVIVGGAPFRLDPSLWREVGADATGRDSAEAVRLVERFLGGPR